MSRKKRFFYNGILLTLVGLAIRSVSMAFNSFVSTRVGAEGIGLFTLIMTVYSFAVTFASSGISLTVTRLVASAVGEGNVGKIKGIMRSAVLYSLIFSVFASLVLFFGAGYFGAGVLGDERAVSSLRILSFSLIPMSLSSVFGGYFVGVKRVAKNAVVQVSAQAFRILITVFLVLELFSGGIEQTTEALCLSITATELLAFLVSLFQYLLDKKEGDIPRGYTAFPEVAAMALPLALSAYIRSALLTLEHVLIPKRLMKWGADTAEALSLYGILHGMALPILLYPMAVLSSFSGLLVPEFAESLAASDKERMRRIATEAINLTLTYSVGVMAFLFVFSEELGYAVYSSYSVGHYASLMAIVVPIMYLDHLTDSMLKGLGEQVYSMWVNISDSVLSVLLIWFLIPRMGIAGYAVVIIVMEGYNFILSALRLRKRIRFSVDPLRSILFPLLSAFISAYLCDRIFINGGEFVSPIWLITKMIFSATAFIGSLMLIKKIKFPTFTHKKSKI